ncbi:hypothetical protein B0H16DRAFT_1882231, partial [Mycena metata]
MSDREMRGQFPPALNARDPEAERRDAIARGKRKRNDSEDACPVYLSNSNPDMGEGSAQCLVPSEMPNQSSRSRKKEQSEEALNQFAPPNYFEPGSSAGPSRLRAPWPEPMGLSPFNAAGRDENLEPGSSTTRPIASQLRVRRPTPMGLSAFDAAQRNGYLPDPHTKAAKGKNKREHTGEDSKVDGTVDKQNRRTTGGKRIEQYAFSPEASGSKGSRRGGSTSGKGSRRGGPGPGRFPCPLAKDLCCTKVFTRSPDAERHRDIVHL